MDTAPLGTLHDRCNLNLPLKTGRHDGDAGLTDVRAGRAGRGTRLVLGLALVAVLAAGCATSGPPPGYRIESLRSEALRALPPEESGDFLPDDLVEPGRLDPTLRLDVRYATTDNFLHWPLYPQPRVFLQRPAAEALVRANQALRPLGFGLVLFDGYRPWYVTQLLWEATPPEQHDFVADPTQGSRHNRGCAIDLTLYELATGREVRMPSAYDDFTERAHPDYAGGAPQVREARDLLRRTMEAEGFTVDDREWWHYDYRDWQRYRIGNRPFKDID